MFAQIGSGACFMLGRNIAMQILDSDRLNAFLAAARDNRLEIDYFKGNQNRAQWVHPFTHFEAQ